MRAWPRRSSSARCRSVVCALYVGSFLRIHSVCFTRSRATHAVLSTHVARVPSRPTKVSARFCSPHNGHDQHLSISHAQLSRCCVECATAVHLLPTDKREVRGGLGTRLCPPSGGIRYKRGIRRAPSSRRSALSPLSSPLLSSTTTLTSPFLHIRVSSLVCCCRDAILFYSPAHLSNIKQAFVPPNPNELDMTRVTCPSWRFVKMFIPSASSTSSLIFALSARKPSRTISSE